MINQNIPISIHFELTDACNARCPQCSRNTIDKNGVLQERNTLMNKDMRIDEYKKIFEGFTGKLKKIDFCGNYGDPIAAKDIYNIIEYTISLNPRSILINTNGSLKTEKWWEDFGCLLKDIDHRCIFSIDGLEDTHHIYRVNTSYDKVIKNAKAFMKGGGQAEWSFIIFRHNEHQVEEAKKRASEMGFESFCEVKTERFGMKEEIRYTFKGKEYLLEPATVNKKEVQETTKKFKSGQKIDINCLSIKRNAIFIDPEGEIYPCCWLGSRDYAKKFIGFNNEDHPIFTMRSTINCIEYPLQECIDDGWFTNIIPSSFENKPCKTCARICGFKLKKKNERILLDT